ncbi:hypothetical protein GCM10025885_22050 [Tetragenococcus osmophilus]|uniref:Uncharacterized protein n=1 Tax=Tetragenococcus osmophilus TaxID=526944 RepID=A0AA37XN69_9ENTE|nr:hypothetical protein GCM10025885_22050 [Tetragenococcus osmophilus]
MIEYFLVAYSLRNCHTENFMSFTQNYSVLKSKLDEVKKFLISVWVKDI